jgi:8-oxo-dGTP diphosphatase
MLFFSWTEWTSRPKQTVEKEENTLPKWVGAAGCCLNVDGELLMVLQAAPGEEKRWTVPSGRLEPGETLAECCMREVWEETGYKVAVGRPLLVKRQHTDGWDVEVHYFEVEITGGSPCIHDPDGFIHGVAWKSGDEIATLNLAFPEDRGFLLQLVRNGYPGARSKGNSIEPSRPQLYRNVL